VSLFLFFTFLTFFFLCLELLLEPKREKDNLSENKFAKNEERKQYLRWLWNKHR
jgi:hypothetical protein